MCITVLMRIRTTKDVKMIHARSGKKLVGALISAVALFCITTPALANNHTDTSWGTTLYAWSNTYRTPPRAKQDRSSSYVKLNAKSNGGSIWAWIETPSSTNVGTAVVNVGVGQQRFITQNVYENGYRQALLGVSDANSDLAAAKVSGVWSPDSV
ncbi:DUF2712 domain-containing protein [Bifidobacterium mongoliense]|jgi:hypothetical protein|nr:DUF2712 domain-containing protein [Bifidobacterium mongoliense]MDN6768687.1 hypothetical protein [Bifidobacterium mongoliense]MDN6783527.1 hypothetical protein [Bifidobacterium mongoliense]